MTLVDIRSSSWLHVHGSRPAVIDQRGRAISYEGLAARVDAFVEQLGYARRLVFVEAAPSVDALAAYLACRQGRHPVLLYGSQDRDRIAPLVDLYGPNALVAADAGGPDIEWRHRDQLNLHDELAVLLSTSGSTGSPKLVKLSHANLDSNARAIASYLGLDESERAMLALKFNYSYGLSVVNSHLATGAAVVLTNHAVTDSAFWTEFRRARATSFAGVPYTFEALRQSGFAFDDLPTLRYATQAGGRLDPALVQHYARRSKSLGWRFIVMYGQTEATARIAYLPHELADRYPDCIGVPIPGGSISLITEAGGEITTPGTPGQLAFAGPNVMMGYARSREELATDNTPAALFTGDLAMRNEAGLFRIVGRASRFVKPFGLRVSLDDLEAKLQATLPGARCAGTDEQIVIATDGDRGEAAALAVARLADETQLPAFVFRLVSLPGIPRLDTGKVDYHGLLAAANQHRSSESRPSDPISALRLIFSREFAGIYADQVAELLGLRRRTWTSIRQIYEVLLDADEVRDADTFKSLAGDSMSYVQVTIALNEYLGSLPADWPGRTVAELERVNRTTHASAF